MIRLVVTSMLAVVMLFLPFTKTTFANESISLTSEAAILIDAKTGSILYEKNSHERMYPASITKIITGIIALEQGNPDDIVTVSQKARNVDGTRVYLLEGEKVPLYKLVQGLLINSGNDAGIAIAEHMSGSTEAFAEVMNQFVKEKVGVTDSHFVNPHGLHDDNHYTTAYDMAKITRYAMQNQEFRKIVGTKELKWDGAGWDTTLYNHNRLLWDYEGAIGVKNGFTSQSGFTLVTAAKRGDRELITVVLKATNYKNLYNDSTKLLDYGFANFEDGKVAKGETYDVNGEKYILKDDLLYVAEKGAVVEKAVNEAGELVISSGGQEITKAKLEKVIPPTEESKKADSQVDKGWFSSFVDFLSVLLFNK